MVEYCIWLSQPGAFTQCCQGCGKIVFNRALTDPEYGGFAICIEPSCPFEEATIPEFATDPVNGESITIRKVRVDQKWIDMDKKPKDGGE